MVSVIIPVHNSEATILKCVDSIINQTITDLEVIIVENGSNDDSLNVCNQLAKRDSRIHVYSAVKADLSYALNLGLDKSTGEFITFVDSDDYVRRDYVEALLNAFTDESIGITMCNLFCEKNGEIYKDENRLQEGKYSFADFFMAMQNSELAAYQVCVVRYCKMYRRQLFNNICYSEGRIHEDNFMIHHIVYAAKYVNYIDKALYVYYQNVNSIMHTSISVRNFDDYYARKDRYLFMCNLGMKELAQITKTGMINNAHFLWLAGRYNGESNSELKKLFSDYKDIYSLRDTKKFSMTKRIRLLVFRYMPYIDYFYFWLMHKIKKHKKISYL